MRARWMVALMTVVLGVPGWVRAQAPSQEAFPLTTQLVAQALSDRGMQVGEDQVTLLAKVVATKPHPQLDIVSVGPLGEGKLARPSQTQSLVKLACRMPGTCLPFHAIVNSPVGSVAKTAGGAEVRPLPVLGRFTPNAPATMRAGTHATLIMEDNRAHIQLRVVSLENGNAGDKIHVASPDHKQVYLARVIGPTLLQRSF